MAFSLGYDCNASLALRRAGLQFASYPFDWLIKAPLEARVELLSRGFEGWLADAGQLDDCGPVPFERFAKRHRIVVDRATGLEFRHDFPLEAGMAEALPAVAEKYRRRAARLLEAIGRAERVLAVYSVGFRMAELPMEALAAARRTLAGAFGDKIWLLGLADDAPGAAGRGVKEERSGDGRVVRLSFPCVSMTPQGAEVSVSKLAAAIGGFAEVPDLRTDGEKRAYRELQARRERAKYGAKSWAGLAWNKMQYRWYRSLAKTLQRKGVLPPNEPGAPGN